MRRAAVGAALLAVTLAAVTRVGATPLYFTGFDAVDTSPAGNRSTLELSLTKTSGNATCAMAGSVKCNGGNNPWPCCTAAGTGNCEHNGTNGGDPTVNGSLFTFFANPGSGQNCYLSLRTPVRPLAKAQLAAGFNLRVVTPPTVARTIYQVQEDLNGDGIGDQVGCFLKLNPDRTLSVYYRTTATLYGTSGEKVQVNSCGAGAGLPADPLTPCTVGSDCPSGVCGSCSSTGAGCFWGAIEVVQTNSPSTTGDRVFCDLWFGGRHTINVGSKPIPSGALALIADAKLGLTDAEASSALLYVDDYVLDDSTRAHIGYVSRTVPAADGPTNQWNGTSSARYANVNDYGTGAAVYDGALLQTSKVSRAAQFSAMAPAVDPGALRAIAVESVILGSTSSTAGTRQLRQNLLICDSTSSCSAVSLNHLFTLATDTSDHLLDAFVQTTTPTGAAWSASSLARAGLELATTAATTYTSGARTNVGAVALYVRVERPDAPLKITAKDHNLGKTCTCATDADCGAGANPGDCKKQRCGQIGARSSCTQDSDCAAGQTCADDDGLLTVYGIGDSTAGATVSSTCQGGTQAGVPCSEPDYCSRYDTKDRPTGGCGAVNAMCQTCAGGGSSTNGGRQLDFNRGVGYACGPNNGGQTCNLGSCTATCDSGVGSCCTGDTTVTCSASADCDLGLCDTCTNADCTSQTPQSTCIASCPGDAARNIAPGLCPTARAAWPDLLEGKMGADVIARCGQGSETTIGLRTVRWPGLIIGREAQLQTCFAIVGHGRCACTPNGPNVADCGASGVCTNGVCTSGLGTRTICTLSSACATGRVCALPPPDYLLVAEHINDTSSAAFSPSCTGWESGRLLAPGEICDFCNTGDPNRGPTCLQDADCTGFSGYPADSQCIGRVSGLWTEGCADNILNAVALDTGATQISLGLCLERASKCRTDLNCPTYGGLSQTCDGGSATGLRAAGVCTCSQDSNCAGGFKCVGASGHKTCRQACASDAACGTGTPPGGCVTVSAALHDGATTTTVCGGRCTCPSDARSCSTDRECYSGIESFPPQTVSIRVQGTCVAGKCTCTGYNTCENEPTCRPQFATWQGGHGHFLALDNFRAMQAMIANFNDPTPPHAVFATHPEANYTPAEESCGFLWTDKAYLGKVAGHLLADAATFPYVVDLRGIAAGGLWQTARVDPAHLNPSGADAAYAQPFADYLNALNVCATGSRTTSKAQPYCQATATGTYTSTACASGSSCGLGQVCVAKPCTTNGDCNSGTGDTCHGDS